MTEGGEVSATMEEVGETVTAGETPSPAEVKAE